MKQKKMPALMRFFIFLVLVMMMYGSFTYSINQLKRSGVNQVRVNNIYLEAAKYLRYLPATQYIANESELDLMIAYHNYHRQEKDYLKLMTNSGSSLKIFATVSEKNRSNSKEYFNYSLLESLNILNRMPWNEKIQNQAATYVNEILNQLQLQHVGSDDQSIAHENLAIYFIRIGQLERANEHFLLANKLDLLEQKTEFANAFIFLRNKRMNLARCISGMRMDDAWNLKQSDQEIETISQRFFINQYYQSWDVALVATTLMTNKTLACQDLANTYQMLFGMES